MSGPCNDSGILELPFFVTCIPCAPVLIEETAIEPRSLPLFAPSTPVPADLHIMASAGTGKAADPKGNIKLLCICGDAPKAYPKRSERELKVRMGQAESLKEKLEAAGRSVDLGCVRFAPIGFETPGGFKAGSSDVLLVVLLCHGVEGDGVPAVAAEFIRGSAATVIAKCLCGLESIAGAGKKLLVSAQCYGGLKFRDKMVEQLPTDWLVHASCGDSTYSTCDAGGKWHQTFAEDSADDLDDLEVAGKW